MAQRGQWRTVAQRVELGRQARTKAPRSAHADWTASQHRRDPVDILSEQNSRRVDWLVPIRHGRMAASPFAFFRGAAAVMAADLSDTPDSGLWVQCGGDAHLANFGAYASPGRKLVFDQNDFDETLPGPWEWDLKRLAASLVIAGEHLGFSDSHNTAIVEHSVRHYCRAMAQYASEPVLQVWYDHVDLAAVESQLSHEALAKRVAAFTDRARSKTSLQALRRLTTGSGDDLHIRHQPPLLVPLRDLPSDVDGQQALVTVEAAMREYAETTEDHMQVLLSRFRLQDVALKVVGVGSVGTRCWVALLAGRDDQDPLFLQVKEAGPSVLEDHLLPSVYPNQGERVVQGQRLIQAESDIFLGWTTGLQGRQFYVRQLRDWKGSADLERGTRKELRFYGAWCARTLAHGHARSGDPVAIDAYLGDGQKIVRAIAAFAQRYAVQNGEDYRQFLAAVEHGTIAAVAAA